MDPTDIWGFNEPPARESLPALPDDVLTLLDRAREGTALTDDEIDALDYIDPGTLVEVQELTARGWVVLDDLDYYLVPAAWPQTHRTWLPDQRPTFSLRTSAAGQIVGVCPQPAGGDDNMLEWLDSISRDAGLPPAPRGRIWLVHSPFEDETVVDILSQALRRMEQRNGPIVDDPDPAEIYAELRARFQASSSRSVSDQSAVARVFDQAGAGGVAPKLVTHEAPSAAEDNLLGEELAALIEMYRERIDAEAAKTRVDHPEATLMLTVPLRFAPLRDTSTAINIPGYTDVFLHVDEVSEPQLRAYLPIR